jgi:hypothetical protein
MTTATTAATVSTSPDPDGVLEGILHIYVAFDWGEELDLDEARRRVPAETQALPRRRRTPSSISYRPAPLHIVLEAVHLDLPEVGETSAATGVTVFDFAAVSLALRVPFRLSAASLRRLAGWLADPSPLLRTARAVLTPLHQQLLPAIKVPLWREDFSEEYFVFQLPPCESLSMPARFLDTAADGHAAWLAGLVRLESGPLSAEEVNEALRLHLSYSPTDLFVPDWAAAVLLDQDCDETLQVIAFANLQLLEFRFIDNRLDDSLAGAYRLVQSLTRSSLPFWRSHDRPLRVLGGLKVEANDLFERTGNVLKLVGDQYLARVYRLVDTRFHLEDWERSILRKLEVAEGVYQVVADQASTLRTEFLEVIVIVLIVLEIVLALVGH